MLDCAQITDMRCVFIGLWLVSLGCQTTPARWVSCVDAIAFDSDRDGSTEIYGLDMSRGTTRQLTHTAHPDTASRFPAWSPGGDAIAFVREGPDGLGLLYVMNSDGTNPRPLTRTVARYEHPTWMPDGHTVVYEMGVGDDWGLYHIGVTNAASGRFAPEDQALYQPSVAPDGRAIAVVTGSAEAWRIGILDVEAATLRVIAGSIDAGSVQWSPDGRWLAFDGVVGTNFDLYRMRPDGTDLERLTKEEAVDARPVWNTPGTELVFHSTRHFGSAGTAETWQEFELYRYDLASRAITRLTDNRAFDGHPDWCTG